MPSDVTLRRLRDDRDPAWRQLIDLYTGTFDEGQRETERAIRQNLVSAKSPREGGHLVVAAEGTGGTCIGGNIFSYLPAIDCGYVSYIFVDPRRQNRGIGTALLEEMRRVLVAEASRLGHGRVRGMFAEIERGRSQDDSLRQRFGFWARAGVLPLALDWRYPPLHDGDPPVPMYLAFGSYATARELWYPGDLEKVAKAIFEATYSYLAPASATLATILEGLRRLPAEVPVAYIRPWQSAQAPHAP